MALKRFTAAASSGAGIAVDLILNSGEIVLSLVAFVLTSPDMLVSIVLYAERLAGMVTWLPAAHMENIAAAAIVLLILVYAHRLITDWRESA